MKTIYIAGPYSGAEVRNTRRAIQAGMRLRRAGACPVIPHLSMLADLVEPEPYQFWIAWDLDLLQLCDALLRLPGDSPGADREVDAMRWLGRPVFFSEEDAVAWIGGGRA